MARTNAEQTDIRPLKTISSTDPASNTIGTTAILDTYSGVVITTTTTGVAQTLGTPTNTDAIKRFSVVNNDTSTDTISINGTDLAVGEKTDFIWDGTARTNAGGGGTPGDTLPIVDTTAVVKGSVDATKLVRIEADGLTTGTTRVITMPDEDITLISAASTDTLTNKTFDANGTGNSLSNVDVADLANGTDGELITWAADGTADTVAVGTAAQVLTSNGVGAAPTFQTPAGGGGVTEIFDAFLSTAQNLTTSNLILQCDSENIDDGNNFNTSTYKFTAPSTGNYRFDCNINYDGLTLGDDFELVFYVDSGGTRAWYNDYAVPGNGVLTGNIVQYLTVGQAVNFGVTNKTSARGTIISGSLFGAHFSGYKLN